MEHLERKEGYRYTQVAETEISERVLAEELYIPDGQGELWTLITEAEAETYQQAKDAAMEAEYASHGGDGVSAAAADDDAVAVDHTVEITCPHCGKTIYYTPATDDTTAVAAGDDEGGEAGIMIDDEL